MQAVNIQTEYMCQVTKLLCLQILPRGAVDTMITISHTCHVVSANTYCQILFVLKTLLAYHGVYSKPKASVFGRKDVEHTSEPEKPLN